MTGKEAQSTPRSSCEHGQPLESSLLSLISSGSTPSGAAVTGIGQPQGPELALPRWLSAQGRALGLLPTWALGILCLLQEKRGGGWATAGARPLQHLEAPPWGKLASESPGWGKQGWGQGSLPGWAPLLS